MKSCRTNTEQNTTASNGGSAYEVPYHAISFAAEVVLQSQIGSRTQIYQEYSFGKRMGQSQRETLDRFTGNCGSSEEGGIPTSKFVETPGNQSRCAFGSGL